MRSRLLLTTVIGAALAAVSGAGLPMAAHAAEPNAAAPLATAAAATAAPPQIWPLGDSITVGVTSAPGYVYTPGGYRGMLDTLFNNAGIAHQFVGTSTENSTPTLASDGEGAHDGHSQYRIDQIVADLDGVANYLTDDGGHWMTGIPGRAPIAPDIVIIHLGTNDILQDYDSQTTFPTSNGEANVSDPAQVATFVTDLTARLKQLVDKIETLHAGTKVVLSNVVPIGDGPVDSVTGAYSNAVQNLVKQEEQAGDTIVFADVWSQFVEPSSTGTMIIPGLLSEDGTHPTAAGYRILASTYEAAVSQLLN